MIPVVVVSAYTMGLAVIRALGEHGVPVVVVRYDASDMGHRSRYVEAVVGSPHPESDPERFVDVLMDVASRYPGAMLVPTCDPSVAVVSRHRAVLRAAGYVVAVPDEAIATTFLDKAATAALAERVGVPAPVTVALETNADVDRYTAAAAFPAIVKPVLSHRYHAAFGRKWTAAEDADGARTEFERARRAGLQVLLQEFVPGDELSGANYNSYCWDGRPCVEFTARKIRNSPPDSGSPSVAVSEHLPGVVDPGRRILRAAGFGGFSCIEFKRDSRDGVYKLIEVNGRHNLSSLLATRCGINFPWLQYRHLVYGELPTPREFTDGRFWVDVARDVRTAAHYLHRPGYSWRRFLRPYLSRPVYAVWSVRDPVPGILRARMIVREMRRQSASHAPGFSRSTGRATLPPAS